MCPEVQEERNRQDSEDARLLVENGGEVRTANWTPRNQDLVKRQVLRRDDVDEGTVIRLEVDVSGRGPSRRMRGRQW